MKSLKTRVSAVERRLGGPGTRLAYSHSQLVEAAWLLIHGMSDVEAWKAVGPPEDVLGPGQRSHAELVAEAQQEFNRREAANVVRNGAPAPARTAGNDPGQGAPSRPWSRQG